MQRYQKKNKCGPHEFGFRHRKENKYIYINLARSSNEAGYLPVRDNGNLYIDLDSIDFDNPNNKAFNLKALIDFKGGEELSINLKSKNYYFLPQAKGADAYFLTMFLVIMDYLKNT